MRVIDVRLVKDCLDADLVRELVFEREIDEEFVMSLKNLGSWQYFPDFPRPYFRIQIKGLCTLQGVVGSVTCRATAVRNAPGSLWEDVVVKLEKGA